jgi:hypothetical protein
MKINPLTDTSKPWVLVKFIHFGDNEEHTFRSEVNSLTGARLSSFDDNAPDVGDTITWVRGVLRGIAKKSNGITFFESSKHLKKFAPTNKN